MPTRDIEKRRATNRRCYARKVGKPEEPVIAIRRYDIRVNRSIPPAPAAPGHGMEHGAPVWIPEVGRMGLRSADGLVVDVGFGDQLPDQQGRTPWTSRTPI